LEVYYKTKIQRSKDNHYRENYMKSSIHRSKFTSEVLNKFKRQVKQLNSNFKEEPQKDPEIRKLEKMKHEQNKRASQKRGLPNFDMESAKKLLDGKFHEDLLEDEDVIIPKLKAKEETIHQSRLEQFEVALRHIFEEKEEAKQEDEIPEYLRNQFNIPAKLGIFELNMQQIRQHDANLKRTRPIWSG